MHSNRGALGIVIKSAISFVILGSGKSKILVVRISMGLNLKKIVKMGRQQKQLANDRIT